MKSKKGRLTAKRITINRKGKSFATTVFVDTNKEAAKYRKLQPLYAKYDSILKRVNSDIKPTMDKYSRAALGAKMLMLLGLRIGNEESAKGVSIKGNMMQTYGLSTLQKKHCIFNKQGHAVIDFLGKKAVEQKIVISNATLVAQLKAASEKSKTDKLLGVSKYEVAEYIRQRIGKEFTPKDLRGFKANMEAERVSKLLMRKPKPTSITAAKAELHFIVEHVSKLLGNTIGVAKRAYIDPAILNRHLSKRTPLK